MAELKFWQNGSKGSEVKRVIETNFKNINTQLNQIAFTYTWKSTLTNTSIKGLIMEIQC